MGGGSSRSTIKLEGHAIVKYRVPPTLLSAMSVPPPIVAARGVDPFFGLGEGAKLPSVTVSSARERSDRAGGGCGRWIR